MEPCKAINAVGRRCGKGPDDCGRKGRWLTDGPANSGMLLAGHQGSSGGHGQLIGDLIRWR